jgi:hypothetical protein
LPIMVWILFTTAVLSSAVGVDLAVVDGLGVFVFMMAVFKFTY